MCFELVEASLRIWIVPFAGDGDVDLEALVQY